MSIIFDLSRMTVEDYIALEEGIASMKFSRGFLAKFMVDQEGKSLTQEEAFRLMNSLTIIQMRQLIARFKHELEELKKAALPPLT